MTDPIGDMLIRIKNGYLARRTTVALPFSKMKETLAKLLVELGYITDVNRDDKGLNLILTLKYEYGVPALSGVKRLSKPGLRKYGGVADLSHLRRGLGQIIVSTPKGLKTHTDAQKMKLGGEIVCAVW